MMVMMFILMDLVFIYDLTVNHRTREVYSTHNDDITVHSKIQNIILYTQQFLTDINFMHFVVAFLSTKFLSSNFPLSRYIPWERYKRNKLLKILSKLPSVEYKTLRNCCVYGYVFCFVDIY